jgi:hypothetical protein
MNQKTLELQERTRRFASAVIRFCEALPRAPAAQHILVAIFVASRKTAQTRKAERDRLRQHSQAAARARLRRK